MRLVFWILGAVMAIAAVGRAIFRRDDRLDAGHDEAPGGAVRVLRHAHYDREHAPDQPGAAVWPRHPAEDVAERVAPLLRERLRLLPVEGAGALPAGGQVLGEEGLHLLPVRVGFGRVRGVHRCRG